MGVAARESLEGTREGTRLLLPDPPPPPPPLPGLLRPFTGERLALALLF